MSRSFRYSTRSESPKISEPSINSARGRLEIVIGKGNEVLQYPLLGLDIAKQYEYLTENYELLKLLISEENVKWVGTHRPSLEDATTLPRPFDGPFRIWHGSATSFEAVELAAKWGRPHRHRQRLPALVRTTKC